MIKIWESPSGSAGRVTRLQRRAQELNEGQLRYKTGRLDTEAVCSGDPALIIHINIKIKPKIKLLNIIISPSRCPCPSPCVSLPLPVCVSVSLSAAGIGIHRHNSHSHHKTTSPSLVCPLVVAVNQP